MEVSRIRALRGPNLWTRHTAIEAIVRCDEAAGRLSSEVEQHLRRLFPALDTIDKPKAGHPPTLAHALEKLTLGLQAEAGCPVSFSRTTATEEPGVYRSEEHTSELQSH